jgi:cytochrome c-type biogenesis protein CcmH
VHLVASPMEKLPRASRARLMRSLILLALLSTPAHAVQPDEILKDPALESRARNISAGLRCLVCQNQSIDDSEAPVAKDLRVLIREQLVTGKSDTEVVDFVVARYGEYVLLKPRFNVSTLALWLAPFAILLAAVFFAFRRRPTQFVDELSAAEKAELDKITRNQP